MGGGGYVLRDPSGEIKSGGGIYFGMEAKTNNVAEAKSMLEAMRKV